MLTQFDSSAKTMNNKELLEIINMVRVEFGEPELRLNKFNEKIEDELEGVYNGVAPNPVTNEELTKELAKKMGKSVWLPNVPEIALKIMLGEMSQIVLSSQLVSSDKIQGEGYQFKFNNLGQALNNLT